MNGNPYQVLGIPNFSDINVIKTAYRRLAMQWHPDRNSDPNAKTKFVTIQLAQQTNTYLKAI